MDEDESFGKSDLGAGKTANVEFVSANPTGPLTVGHGRNAVLGDTVSNILEWQGFDVTREYYFNDATITQLAEGRLQVGGNVIEAKPNHAINGISFVQGKNLTPNIDNDGYAEKAGYWGYLKDLYVNLDMLIAKTKQPNKSIRERKGNKIFFICPTIPYHECSICTLIYTTIF